MPRLLKAGLLPSGLPCSNLLRLQRRLKRRLQHPSLSMQSKLKLPMEMCPEGFMENHQSYQANRSGNASCKMLQTETPCPPSPLPALMLQPQDKQDLLEAKEEFNKALKEAGHEFFFFIIVFEVAQPTGDEAKSKKAELLPRAIRH